MTRIYPKMENDSGKKHSFNQSLFKLIFNYFYAINNDKCLKKSFGGILTFFTSIYYRQ